ncbi:hypothetical protein [Siphonobacter sp. BAB-5385]|uniref:hypothetical protein n=1 Tax=Siphonobacter sp. BAB-5385 TaxID=1864822 RepID=UPI0020CC8FFF|nr:hypothetical protein [Siphonobacter sp. BAB-5385]
MKRLFLWMILVLAVAKTQAQQMSLDTLLPVRGFCIAAPLPNRLDEFIRFIDTELAPRKVNTLVLRVDYNYQFKTHPELRDSVALSKARYADSCKPAAKIRLR